MITPAQIIAAARECLDTPFQHQGRVPGVGIDCAGVVVHVARSCGITHHDAAGYSRTPHSVIESIMDAQPALMRAPPESIQPGDFLLMHFEHEPQHLAVYTGDTIVHCYQAVGKCVEHRLDHKWRRRIVRGYRLSCMDAPMPRAQDAQERPAVISVSISGIQES